MIQGPVKIVIESTNTDILSKDAKTSDDLVIELQSGDFIEPSSPLSLNYFKSERLLEINKLLRDQ